MKYLLDTDTCVYWLRGRQSVYARVAAAGLAAIAISVITLAELRYGAACSQQPEANQQAVDAFANGIVVLNVDPNVVRVFADLKAHLRKEGMLIEDFDMLIGATARTFGLTLVTNNTDHFRRISNLHLENWI